jgi:hypothetical protein
LVRGHLSTEQHVHELARVRKFLAEAGPAHFKEFAAAWPET